MPVSASSELDDAYGAKELERLRALGLASNKEIRRFKVAINTACPLRCEYCFIDKDSGETIGWRHVESLVRFQLSSPGKVKKLLLYGGEPFMNFEIVREIALYARAEALKAGKDLDLSICTSASLPLKREWLEFLAEQRFFLSVSMDGDAETHDKRRVDKQGKGSWKKMLPNLPTMAEVGLPGVVSSADYALYAPVGTPKEVIALVNREMHVVLQMPDIRTKLGLLGIELAPSTPEALQAELHDEFAKWGKLIREANIKLE